MFIRIVQLPSFRAASFHVKDSETPERDAWTQLEAWAGPGGLLDNPTVYQVFGRNNPTPMQQPRLRGYEFLVSIPKDYVLEPGVAEVTFSGGLYAVVRSKGIPAMVLNYEAAFCWIQNSAEYAPDYPEGYDFEHMPGLELENNLDPHHEDENTMLIDAYIPIKRRK